MSDQEVELKFALAPGQAAALTGAAPLNAEPTEQAFRTTYFDTPDGELRARGLGLRRRLEDGAPVLTLKSSAPGALGRGEHRMPAPGASLDPALLEGTAAEDVAAQLEPVFALEVRRRSWRLFGAGAAIEAALDEGVVTAGDRRAAFVELELELLSGETAGLFQLARELSAVTPLHPSRTGKADRGWRLLGGEAAADHAGAAADLAGRTAGEALQAVLRQALDQAVANAETLRGGGAGDGVEAVHQLRVGLRRFRALLKLFRPLAPGDPALAQLQAELRWFGALTGPVRDRDALLEALEDLRDAQPEGVAALSRRLQEQRRAAFATLTDALAGARAAALLREAQAWVEAGPWLGDPATEAARAAPAEEAAAAALRRQRKRLLHRGEDLAGASPHGRHKARIAAKVLRYGLDQLASLLPHQPERAAMLKALKRVQASLGELNDHAVAEQLLRDAAEDAPSGYAAGLIVGGRRCEEQPLIAEAQRRLDALSALPKPW